MFGKSLAYLCTEEFDADFFLKNIFFFSGEQLREEFDAYKVLGSKGVGVGSMTTWEVYPLEFSFLWFRLVRALTNAVGSHPA